MFVQYLIALQKGCIGDNGSCVEASLRYLCTQIQIVMKREYSCDEVWIWMSLHEQRLVDQILCLTFQGLFKNRNVSGMCSTLR